MSLNVRGSVWTPVLSEVLGGLGSSSTFSLYVKDASAGAVFELRLTTGQAPDIAAVILDYINAIMEAS